MEENKLIYLIGIVVAIIVIVASALGIFIYNQNNTPVASITNTTGPENINVSTSTQPGFLPSSQTTTSTDAERLAAEKLEKEKRFISTYWQPLSLNYKAEVISYKLPFTKIKEQVANYRDVSRKINIEPALPLLTKNGFAVINNQFKPEVSDWETAFANVRKNSLPTFVSSDAIAGIYQTTLGVIYRETEQEIFYSSLWSLLKEMHDKVLQRYELKRRQLGIESDTITEANRMELAYISVGLKLLEPEKDQIKEALAGDDRFFSPLEAQTYKLNLSSDLTDEVSREVKLIGEHPLQARSPIFGYTKSYDAFKIPAYYQGSEKLKNYYLAATWLNDTLFPLWNTADSCDKCLLDQQDHAINFVSALYLSNDLSASQSLQNRWANIYKTIGFFRGMEIAATYLYYDQALKSIYGNEYDLNKIFSASQVETQKAISQIQQKIDSYQFPVVLSGNPIVKESKGMRLLRKRYLPEEQLFSQMVLNNMGKFLEPDPRYTPLPFTTCYSGKIERCFPTAMDLFNFLDNQLAKTVLRENKDSYFENYDKKLAEYASNFKSFDGHTWHDNAYLSLLYSLKTLNNKKGSGFPVFMQTSAWTNKSLNTQLSIWTDFHSEVDYEKSKIPTDEMLTAFFPYGYIEPQPEFYSELKTNVEMIMTGFASLQIISPQTKSYERLLSLKNILDNAAKISIKELDKNATFEREDYDFINNFSKQIRNTIGDIKKENIQNKFSFNIFQSGNDYMKEYLDGLNYIVVVYPEKDGKLIFAVGPTYNYFEQKNNYRQEWAWQSAFKAKMQ